MLHAKGFPRVDVVFTDPHDGSQHKALLRVFEKTLELVLAEPDIAPPYFFQAREDSRRHILERLRHMHGFPPTTQWEFLTISEPIPPEVLDQRQKEQQHA